MDFSKLPVQPVPKAPGYPPPPIPPPPCSASEIPPPSNPPPPIPLPLPPPPIPLPLPPLPPPPPPTSGSSDLASVDVIAALKAKLLESEQNLKAHKEKMKEQQNLQILETIRSSENEIINRMSAECGLQLETLSSLLTPLDRDYCSTMSLSRANQWVLSQCVTVKSIETVFRYLTATINEKNTSAKMKLHILYLLNEMFGNWIKKRSTPFLTLTKQYLPLMYASAYCQITDKATAGRLEHLKNFWINHHYIGEPEIERMNNIDATLHKYLERQKEAFSGNIAKVIEKFLLQYRQYETQHENFARYVETQIQAIENARNAALLKQARRQQYQNESAEVPAKHPRMVAPMPIVNMNRFAGKGYREGAIMGFPPHPGRFAPNMGPPYPPRFMGTPPFPNRGMPYGMPPRMFPVPRNGRFEPRFYPHFSLPGGGGGGVRPFRLGGNGNGFRPWPRNGMMRPPYAGGAPPPPPPPMPMRWNYEGPYRPPPLPLGGPCYPMPPRYPFGPGLPREPGMIAAANRGPYHTRPAGLMLATVRLDDDDYRSLDPMRLRYSHLLPPDEQILGAMDAFYRRPNHENPRDSAGWERTGMYEYFRSKRNAVHHKKELRKGRGYDSRSPRSSVSSSASDSVKQSTK